MMYVTTNCWYKRTLIYGWVCLEFECLEFEMPEYLYGQKEWGGKDEHNFSSYVYTLIHMYSITPHYPHSPTFFRTSIPLPSFLPPFFTIPHSLLSPTLSPYFSTIPHSFPILSHYPPFSISLFSPILYYPALSPPFFPTISPSSPRSPNYNKHIGILLLLTLISMSSEPVKTESR